MGNIWHTWHNHPGRRGVITTGGELALLLPEGLVLLLPGLEVRRALPGPQTLWLARDLLLRLAWHALPWLPHLAAAGA